MGKRGRVSAYCAAINCTNNRKLCPDIQFYRFPLETSRWVGICYFRDFPHSFSHANSALFLGYNDILHTHFPICLFRCKQWVQNCRREDLLDKSSAYLSNNCFMCAEHFEPQYLPKFKNIRGRLSKGAIPTLFEIRNPPPTIGSKRPAPKPMNSGMLI